MIDYFYNYIKNIIFFLIFMSFIQVILPTNKYRSYINLIFGMILVFIMIEPLNILFDNVKNIEAITIFNEDDFKNNNIDINKYKNIQNEMVKSAFKDNIKKQIETILKDNYFIKDIEVSLYENKYDEINIQEIQLTLTSNNKNIYVKPFKEDNDLKLKEQKEIDNIKNTISQYYNLNIENISIMLT